MERQQSFLFLLHGVNMKFNDLPKDEHKLVERKGGDDAEANGEDVPEKSTSKQ